MNLNKRIITVYSLLNDDQKSEFIHHNYSKNNNAIHEM